MSYINVANVLSIHANFINLYDAEYDLSNDKLEILHNTLMCKDDRFAAACSANLVAPGEIKRAEDQYGRRMVLIGFRSAQAIVLYERYVQGDEGCVTCDMPTPVPELSMLRSVTRLENSHLVDIDRLLNDHIGQRNPTENDIPRVYYGVESLGISDVYKAVWDREFWLSQFDNSHGLTWRNPTIVNIQAVYSLLKLFTENTNGEGVYKMTETLMGVTEYNVWFDSIAGAALYGISSEQADALANAFGSAMWYAQVGELLALPLMRYEGINIYLAAEVPKLHDSARFYLVGHIK